MALVQEVASGNKVLLWLQRAQLIEALLYVGACHPASPATETKQPWRHWVQLAWVLPMMIMCFGLARRTPRKRS